MSEDDPESISSIGDRLKAAREAKKMTLEEIANTTRIPIRHLQHIENEEWEALPAPTYSVGFARSYANAVGLNGNAIGAELRQQIGTARPAYEAPQSYYQPADPARVPPRSLAIFAGVIAVVLVAGYIVWRGLTVGNVDEADVVAAASQPAATPAVQAQGQPLGAPAPSAATATGPVVLTATDEVWFRVSEGGDGSLIRDGILHSGQSYEVPATARAPQIRTGRPQALRVTVGSTPIPPLGAPEQTIDKVSLLPADLIARSQGAAAAPLVAPTVAPSAQRQ